MNPVRNFKSLYTDAMSRHILSRKAIIKVTNNIGSETSNF